MQQPTEENTRRPSEIKLIYNICISLSIYWGITLFSFLFVWFFLYMLQAWAEVELIPFYFPSIIFIMLIIVGFSGGINYNFLRLKKWAFPAMLILQFVYIIGSVFAIIFIEILFIKIASAVAIGMSSLILYHLNKSRVKQAFGL
jgi:hypothetical protein